MELRSKPSVNHGSPRVESTNPAIPQKLVPKFSDGFETRILNPDNLDPISQVLQSVSLDTSEASNIYNDPTELDEIERNLKSGLASAIKDHLLKFPQSYEDLFKNGENPDNLSKILSDELMGNFMHVVALSKSSLEDDINNLRSELAKVNLDISNWQDRIDSSASMHKKDAYGKILRDAKMEKMKIERDLDIAQRNFDQSSSLQHELSFDMLFHGTFEEMLAISIQSYKDSEKLDRLRAQNRRFEETLTMQEFGAGHPVQSDKLYARFSSPTFNYDFLKFFSRLSPGIHANNVANENTDYENSIREFSDDKLFILFDHISQQNLETYNKIASSISERGGDHTEFTNNLADLVIHYLVRIYGENVDYLDNKLDGDERFSHLANQQISISAIQILRIGLVNNLLNSLLTDYGRQMETSVLEAKNGFLQNEIENADNYDGDSGLLSLSSYRRSLESDIWMSIDENESKPKMSILSINLDKLDDDILNSFSIKLREFKYAVYRYSDTELRVIWDSNDPEEIPRLAKEAFDFIQDCLCRVIDYLPRIRMSAATINGSDFLKALAERDLNMRPDLALKFFNSLFDSKLDFALGAQHDEFNSTFYFDGQIYDWDKDFVKEAESDHELVADLYEAILAEHAAFDFADLENEIKIDVDISELIVPPDSESVLSRTIFNSEAIGGDEVTKLINVYLAEIRNESSVSSGIYSVARSKASGGDEITKPIDLVLRERRSRGVTKEMPVVLRRSLLERLASL